jgi:hypothetical protein
MIFGSFLTNSGNPFSLNPKIHPALNAMHTPLLHPGHAQRDRQAGPGVKLDPPARHPRQRAALTTRLSPPVSSPAVWSSPAAPPRQGGPRGGLSGVEKHGDELRPRAWRRGGSARRRPTNSDRDGVCGVACELHRASAVLVYVRSGREIGWRGEVHIAVRRR